MKAPAFASSEPAEIWLDVGAHLGEKTLPAARSNPALRVYAFEPNLRLAMRLVGLAPNFVVLPMAVAEQTGTADFHLNSFEAASSLLPFDPTGLQRWIGGDVLRVVETVPVPVIRLDTFMELAGIGRVDYLKIDAQGGDLEVVRSAGDRIRSIGRISLEVQITPFPLYAGGAKKEDVLEYLLRSGFRLEEVEQQSHVQEENLTFSRVVP
ncbi:MAG: FkbM family methyltransferase [Bryobacteraceae bacterium]